eukprot:TRINITY_DN22719_c0_g1_i1.p2 TRINITY_DN22719_c0_g1~~TRINITY_DN22719_c0_g1_i1.p2  ORF type:complete len:263 (+),score=67.64 TRINITY_DN22719_c0_g1_i1:894-1682(+)
MSEATRKSTRKRTEVARYVDEAPAPKSKKQKSEDDVDTKQRIKDKKSPNVPVHPPAATKPPKKKRPAKEEKSEDGYAVGDTCMLLGKKYTVIATAPAITVTSDSSDTGSSDDEPAPKRRKPTKKAAADKKSPAKGKKGKKSAGDDGAVSRKAVDPPESVLKKLTTSQHDELMALSINDLKDRLRANQQLVGGKLPDLQRRVADCVVNGAMPRCPQCGLGFVKRSSNGYFCPGGYDDDHFAPCNYTCKLIVRPAWIPDTGKSI